MKTSVLVVSSIFALICSAANWHSLSVYEKAHSTTKVDWNGAGIIILLSIVLLFFLTRSIYKSIRVCLDKGIRIPRRIKFINWGPCLLLAPMIMIGWGASSSETLSGGILYTHSFGYGSETSFYAVFVAALTILAYQLAAGLYQYRSKTEQGAAANP